MEHAGNTCYGGFGWERWVSCGADGEVWEALPDKLLDLEDEERRRGEEGR